MGAAKVSRLLHYQSSLKHSDMTTKSPQDPFSRDACVASTPFADFVWRAGGAIAEHARKGRRMKAECQYFDEGCESAGRLTPAVEAL